MLYAVIGPRLLGHATTMYEGAFTMESTVKVIDSQAITNITAAPTAYRLMMAAGDDAVAPIAGRLRVASSAGEPLNPAAKRRLVWPDLLADTEIRKRHQSHRCEPSLTKSFLRIKNPKLRRSIVDLVEHIAARHN
jgi:hypothetical protein